MKKLSCAAASAVAVLILCSCGDLNMKKPKEVATEAPTVEVYRKEVIQSSERAPLQIVQRGTLRIDSESIPMTTGRDLIIETDNLVSDGAVIQTFPSDAVAKDGEQGRSAGRIFIRAKSISGTLTLIMQGEKGGRGAKGAQGAKGETGAVGQAYMWGNDVNFYQKYCYFGLEKSGAPINGDLTPYLRGHPCTGGKGGVGHKGFTGGVGFSGGDAGTVQISIPGIDESQIQVISLPGEGGDGGEGGEPGEGGDGGHGGLMDQGLVKCDRNPCCPPAPSGERGAPGTERGDEGSVGTSGANSKILFNGRLQQAKEKVL